MDLEKMKVLINNYPSKFFAHSSFEFASYRLRFFSKGNDSKEPSGNSKAEDKKLQTKKSNNDVCDHVFTCAGSLIFYF